MGQEGGLDEDRESQYSKTSVNKEIVKREDSEERQQPNEDSAGKTDKFEVNVNQEPLSTSPIEDPTISGPSTNHLNHASQKSQTDVLNEVRSESTSDDKKEEKKSHGSSRSSSQASSIEAKKTLVGKGDKTL